MRSLLRFLLQNYFIMLFLILEVIALTLVVSYNNFQRVRFLNSSNSVVASFYERNRSITDYFHLKQQNQELALENTLLRNRLQERMLLVSQNSHLRDTIAEKKYVFTTAKVINNSVNKQFNYITINKGSIHGIRPDMGIITPNGAVGIINNVSRRYSTAISLLNKKINVSAKIKKNNFYGPLTWDGTDYQVALLKEIPLHASLQVGDTIITSSYSTIFPEGIMLGTIKNFSVANGENFFHIEVQLSTDFKAIDYVDVIKNVDQNEILDLEKRNKDD